MTEDLKSQQKSAVLITARLEHRAARRPPRSLRAATALAAPHVDATAATSVAPGPPLAAGRAHEPWRGAPTRPLHPGIRPLSGVAALARHRAGNVSAPMLPACWSSLCAPACCGGLAMPRAAAALDHSRSHSKGRGPNAHPGTLGANLRPRQLRPDRPRRGRSADALMCHPAPARRDSARPRFLVPRPPVHYPSVCLRPPRRVFAGRPAFSRVCLAGCAPAPFPSGPRPKTPFSFPPPECTSPQTPTLTLGTPEFSPAPRPRLLAGCAGEWRGAHRDLGVRAPARAPCNTMFVLAHG